MREEGGPGSADGASPGPGDILAPGRADDPLPGEVGAPVRADASASRAGESPTPADPGPDDPFATVRTRTVIPWMIGGTIILLVALHIAGRVTPLDLSGESAGELAGMVAGYTALLTWILWICKRSGIGLRRLVGHPPAWFIWLIMPALLVVAMTFSIGSWILFAYTLSMVAPGVLEFLLGTMDTPVDQSITYRVGMFLVVVVMAPVLEEISFRGLLLNRWSYKWGLGKALIATSLAFGILHANPVGITVIGLLAAILYIQTGSLVVPIALHALNNLAATFLVYALEWGDPAEGGGAMDIAAEIDEIQASGPTGLLLVAVTLPVIVWYVRRYWPGRGAAGPYVAIA